MSIIFQFPGSSGSFFFSSSSKKTKEKKKDKTAWRREHPEVDSVFALPGLFSNVEAVFRSLPSSSREEEEAVTRTYLENLLHPRGKSRATTGSPSTTLSRLQSSCGLEADDRKIPTASTSLPFFPFARAKGGRDYRRMDSWCTFLFLLAFEGEEKMKDAPGK